MRPTRSLEAHSGTGTARPACLEDLPNIGPAMAADLRQLGVQVSADLQDADGCELYGRLCRLTERYHDPCVLDTLLAVVDHIGGAPARPWWHYTAQRKASERCQQVLQQARSLWAARPR